MKRILCGCIALALCGALSHSATAAIDTASFTYSDTSGNAATASLTGQSSGLGDNSYWMTGGTITVSAYSFADGVTGTFLIDPAVGPGVTVASPSAYVDNLFFPNNNAGSSVNWTGTNPSYLTNWGLFAIGTGSATGYAVNIWGNGNGDYALLESTYPGGAYDGSNPNAGGTLSNVSSTPEPSSMAAWGLGVAAVFFVSRRRRIA